MNQELKFKNIAQIFDYIEKEARRRVKKYLIGESNE